MDEDFYRRQSELLSSVIREQDVVITTAAVPGRKAPDSRHCVDGCRHGPRFGHR